jgi:hypothetical protein
MSDNRPPSGDGPSLETYLETRLNLLNARVDEQSAAIRERVDGVEEALAAYQKTIDGRFTHADQLNALVQESAKRAVDKAESAQHAHNIASNEWRGTLNDFKNTLVSKAEFEQLRTDFAAYRLEQSRLNSSAAGAKEATKETRDDNKSLWAMVIAVASIAVSVVVAVMSR